MNITSGKLFPRKRFILVFIILFIISAILAGCSGSPSTPKMDLDKMAPMSDMPAEVQSAPETVQVAYQFAIAYPDALKNVPCYCGCGKVGHTSNYSCYVKEIKSSGEVIFDNHALACSICVDIAQDVLNMTTDGKSPEKIREFIDLTYSQYGTSNMQAVQ
jgi:hypothetical protein